MIYPTGRKTIAAVANSHSQLLSDFVKRFGQKAYPQPTISPIKYAPGIPYRSNQFTRPLLEITFETDYVVNSRLDPTTIFV
jgi:hypothetical protein